MNHGRSQLDESRIRTEVFRRDCIRASYDRLEEYYGVAEEGQFKKNATRTFRDLQWDGFASRMGFGQHGKRDS